MKKTLLVCALSLCLSGVVQAGIPVNVIGDATATKNQLETMAQWVSQLAEMKAQYDQMVSQYKAITGSRNLWQILNNPALKDYLPDEWQKVFDEVQKAGQGGMTADGRKIYDKNKVFERCKSSSDSKMKALCEAGSVQSAQHLSNLMKSFETAKGRLEQIEGLMSKINETTDAKSIAELQARIGAENALIQNEQSKLAMYNMISEAQEKLRLEQIKQANVKNATKQGGVKVRNLNF